MLSFITGSWSAICATIASIFFMIYTFIIRKNAVLDTKNESLEKQMQGIKNETNKIIAIQKKQNEVASAPNPSRNELYDRLRDISVRNSSKT